MRHSRVILAALLLSLATRATWALDPHISAGVGGKGGPAHVTAGSGPVADASVHTGFPLKGGAGQIGITAGGCTGSTNKPTDDGFHSAGLGKIITAGIGSSTMDSVPGRSPTYVNIVAGTRTAPLVGNRGP